MTASATLSALLSEAIDYAGLFPPARLSMTEAVGRYADYLDGPDSWALGRFVLPVSRLDEFTDARERTRGAKRSWRLSAVLGADARTECASVQLFNGSDAQKASIDSVEMKLSGEPRSSREHIRSVAGALPPPIRIFAELPIGPDLVSLVSAARSEHAGAKIRTGGVTADAFPSAADVARFLECCAREQVSFKATAGLHHPCRGRYPLTYDTGAPTGTMFGFLNVLLGATLAHGGTARSHVIAILETEQGSEFCFSDDELTWRDVRVSRAQVVQSRRSFMLSFGSCSFEEPIHDLRSLSLL
jgi:hypothetical protein